MTRRPAPRPRLPYEEQAAQLKFAKPQYKAALLAQMDTSAFPLRKIHPFRDEGFRRWLHFQPCVIFGLIDALTEQPHVCWSPGDRLANGRYRSDPMHLEKAYSGRLKRDDRYAVPGCRLAHNMQEGDDARFARRFGIDTRAIAESKYAEYLAEQERSR